MSEKITIQDIIELLAEKHSMDKKDAEAFVKGMFEVIEEALTTEKYVKVKGLGTFKLTEVESRGSVNVNTGERIEIQGHTKISFTPDVGIKDLINKPFAHFETVILNENTQLEDTETEIEGDEKEEAFDEVASNVPQEEVAVPQEPETITETSEEEETAVEELVAVVEETVVDEPVVVETATEESRMTEKTHEEEVMTIADAAIQAAREGKTLSEAMASEEAQPVVAPIVSDPEEEKTAEEAPETTETKHTKTLWAIVIAVILILCIAGGIYWYLQSSDNAPASQSPVTIVTPQAPVVETVPAVPANDSLMQANDTTVHQSPDIPKERPVAATKGNKSVAKETLADTVEYDIVGTETDYTLKEGESLVKLAVRFYGTKKLWPYIVKYNKDIIKDANRVPIGTTLRIPKLTPKK